MSGQAPGVCEYSAEGRDVSNNDVAIFILPSEKETGTLLLGCSSASVARFPYPVRNTPDESSVMEPGREAMAAAAALMDATAILGTLRRVASTE